MYRDLIFTLALTISLFLQACASQQPSPIERAKQTEKQQLKAEKMEEPWELEFDNRNWSEDYRGAKGNRTLIEYTVNNESVQNWSELVTSLTATNVNITPKATAENMVAQLQNCSGLQHSISSKEKKDLILIWSHQGCGKYKPQKTITRIKKQHGNLYSLSYATKRGADRSQQWRKIIENARLRQ